MKKNLEVKLVKLNWDDECRKDFLCGRAIDIKEQPFTKEEKNLHGSHSPIFNLDWEDENAFEDRYRCQCKKRKGRIYDGELCPECNTEIKFRDVDLKTYGWIRIKRFKVIQPAFYRLLSSFIGEAVLNDIITFTKDVTRDGQLKDKPNKNPYNGIGMVDFYERFNEIMLYFRDKKKDKIDKYEEIMNERHSVFTSAIPIYSSVLRPVSFKGESLFFNPVDKRCNYILSLVILLNKKVAGDDLSNYKKKRQRMDMPTTLYKIQKKLQELYDTIFVEVNQKDGHIKSDILGGRLNFSARCVIIPCPYLKADEIRLGYLAFLELFKYEIMAHICKMNDITITEAYEIWFKAATNFSSKVYEIMKYLIKKKKTRWLINRNPSINYGSILCMKIKEVKADKDDYTMSIPIQVLKVLNADFDGKILPTMSVMV
jgi:DNA-directed RNA polymerase beta' subunit